MHFLFCITFVIDVRRDAEEIFRKQIAESFKKGVTDEMF